ncbi:MAG: dehydrogenase, partial [Paenibacillus sp.]|nr:dehydrogenase [Paenibacillus sp.]
MSNGSSITGNKSIEFNDGSGLRMAGQRVVISEAYRCLVEQAEWTLADVPEDSVMIRTEYSLISPGTELAFYTGTHIDLNNPDNRWAKYPFYSGYASVGEVIAVGDQVTEVKPGQKVLALGRHASYDVICYTEEYIVPLPEHVDPKHALFARLAEISSSALIHSKFQAGSHVAII